MYEPLCDPCPEVRGDRPSPYARSAAVTAAAASACANMPTNEHTHHQTYTNARPLPPKVRSCCLGVLTPLVLGGRLTAKGSVAKLARLLVDEDAGVRGRGQWPRFRV